RLVAMAGHGARSFRAGIMIEHRRLSSSPLRGEVAPKAPERAGAGDIADYTRVLEAPSFAERKRRSRTRTLRRQHFRRPAPPRFARHLSPKGRGSRDQLVRAD